MAKTRYSNPSELQKRQLASILSRQNRPSAFDQAQESTQDGTKNVGINFESALPQQNSLICRLPPEIRSYIYLVLWREAGLTQHVNPKDVWDEHPFHYRCITQEIPEPNGQAPESLGGAETFTQLDPEERAPLNEGCYFCRLKFDYGFDEVRGPPPTLEKSAFLPMLLSCKIIHLEVLESIGRQVCFNFLYFSYATYFFIEIQPPMAYHLRHICMVQNLCGEEWQSQNDWINLTKVFYQLPKLQRITFYMDVDRLGWWRELPRRQVLNPRLCFWFAWLPPHIRLEVSIPCDSLEDTEVGERGHFFRFLKMSGGLVEGATLDMILGEDHPKTRPEVTHYPRLELPE
ncbi:hypothetical protein NCS56_00832300 [Fusarium sp. Ph1]|nr:hypothetical protein NCS56_00832300 [Fusarium sp. Ph1]